MILKKLPPLWLIILIVGIPQLSETVYTPSLPSLAEFFHVSHSSAEYTLTIYLFSFAIGTLFWGWLSDLFGRKICVLYGIIIFIFGSLECFFASSFTMLMFGRFIQGFGGSIGSVLGQAICRDAFHGYDLGKAYSTVAMALAFFPVIGPVIGGVITELYNWHNIFMVLALVAFVIFVITVFFLPETHAAEKRATGSLMNTYKNYWILLKNHEINCAFSIFVSICILLLVRIMNAETTQYGQ